MCLGMCVCIYVCVCIHVCLCVCVYMYACMHACMYVCMYVGECVFVCVQCMYECTQGIRLYVSIYVLCTVCNVCMYMYVRLFVTCVPKLVNVLYKSAFYSCLPEDEPVRF
jgi:nuclear pore complex protein Nup62